MQSKRPQPISAGQMSAGRCVTTTSVHRISVRPVPPTARGRLEALIARLVCTTASITDWATVVSSSACDVRDQTQSTQSLQEEAADVFLECNWHHTACCSSIRASTSAPSQAGPVWGLRQRTTEPSPWPVRG